MTNSSDFREWGKEMVDCIADYLDGIHERPPLAQVQPGYLRSLIPDEAPQYPDKWQDVMQDIERVIMPGVSILNFTIDSDKNPFRKIQFLWYMYKVT